MHWNNPSLAIAVAILLLFSGAPLEHRHAASQTLPLPAQTNPATETPKRAATEFFVMIDPAHGGEEKGAALGPRSFEKDFTLALARELKRELQERGVAARLLRDGDFNLNVERRAEITNEDHAGIYVALHAGGPGAGIRVYAPALPFATAPSAGRFLAWESAQSGSLERSRALARSITPELRRKGFRVATLNTPLRPLNNVVGTAIAVEVAPAAKGAFAFDNQKLNALASALAEGIAQARGVRP